jgi:hypothetical protein
MANLASSPCTTSILLYVLHVAALLLLSLPYLTSIIGVCVLRALHRVRVRAELPVWHLQHPPFQHHTRDTISYSSDNNSRPAPGAWDAGYCISQMFLYGIICQSPSFNFKWAPGVFYTYFYNHAHRLRLEKLLYIELSRSSNGRFKPLLDPDDRSASETAARRF